jgi:hypothetical protein
MDKSKIGYQEARRHELRKLNDADTLQRNFNCQNRAGDLYFWILKSLFLLNSGSIVAIIGFLGANFSTNGVAKFTYESVFYSIFIFMFCIMCCLISAYIGHNELKNAGSFYYYHFARDIIKETDENIESLMKKSNFLGKLSDGALLTAFVCFIFGSIDSARILLGQESLIDMIRKFF